MSRIKLFENSANDITNVEKKNITQVINIKIL